MANRNTQFLLKRSNIPGKVPIPGDLLLGELALNTADVILYTSGTTANQILPIGWDRLSITGGTVNGNVTINGTTTSSGLTLTNITNSTGDFITITNSNVIKRRTPSEVLSDIGAQPTLTNPITGTGTSGQVSFFNGTTTQSGDNGLFWNNTNKRLGIGTTTPSQALEVIGKAQLSVASNLAPINLPRNGTSNPSGTVDGDIWYRSSNLYYNNLGTIRAIAHTGSFGAMSIAEGQAGTAGTNRYMRANRLGPIISAYAPTLTGTGASGTWDINITGNAATATTLQTTRTITIGSTGKTFNGSANVAWTLGEIGVNNSTLTLATSGIATGDQTWTSNQGSNATFTVNVPATNLGTAVVSTNSRSITSSTGSNITVPVVTTTVAGFMSHTDKTKLDGIAAGAQVNVGTNLGITAGTTAGPIVTSSTGNNATLPTASGTASGVVTTGNQTWAGVKTFTSTIKGDLDGNATTATTLQTARNIGGVSFNGSANINLPGVNIAGNQNTTGNAATATTLQTARNINGVSFNGSVNITLPTVNTSGNQTIGGTKTFSSAIVANGGITRAGTLNLSTTGNNVVRINTNGSERLRVAGNGNVGIGTTTPDVNLDIVTPSSLGGSEDAVRVTGLNSLLRTAITNRGQQRWVIADGTLNERGVIEYATPGGNVGIVFRDSNSNSRSDFRHIQGGGYSFHAHSLSSAPPERMRITSAGNVGIGTASPSTKLVVFGGEGTYNAPNFGSGNRGAIHIRSQTTNRRNAITFSPAATDSAQAGIYVHQDNSAGTRMHFATTNSYATGPQARVTIQNNGHVGIGTTSPQKLLHVSGEVRIDSTATAPSAGSSGIDFNGEVFIIGSDEAVLTIPSEWLKININGTDYKIPAYA